MNSNKKSTLNQVAQVAQTSPATVDRVLNNRGGVSNKLTNRVLDAANSLMIDRDLKRINRSLLRFSVLMNRPDQDIYVRVQKALEDYQTRHPLKNFIFNFHYFSSQSSQDICSRIKSVDHGFDGAIIIAYNSPEISEQVTALSKKIPVVTLIADLPKSDRIYFSGNGSFASGNLAGDLMGRFLQPKKGTILIISRIHYYTTHLERETGFKEVISRQYPNINIISIECDYGDERDLESIKNAVKDQNPLVGIYSVSSWNISLIQMMKDEGMLKGAITISHGVNKRSRQLLQNKDIDMLIEYCPESYASLAIDALLSHYKRNNFTPSEYRHRLEVFTPEYLPPALN